nr:unnamed protein product [Spirometra erinaceieuropaei]
MYPVVVQDELDGPLVGQERGHGNAHPGVGGDGGDAGDVDNVAQFFQHYTVQCTYKEGPETIAVIHIPSCVPIVAAYSWVRVTMPADWTTNKFLSNQWAAQLALNSDLMVRQRNWEMFWNESVRKGGEHFEQNGFNLEYWRTKAGDMYPLMTSAGQKFPSKEGSGTYDEDDLNAWLNSFQTPQVAAPAQPHHAAEQANFRCHSVMAGNRSSMDQVEISSILWSVLFKFIHLNTHNDPVFLPLL